MYNFYFAFFVLNAFFKIPYVVFAHTFIFSFLIGNTNNSYNLL